MSIRFGTDGWRAIIGEDFIPENIAQVIQAFADRYPKLPEAGKPVFIGYDRRNKSKESADLIASVLLGNHIPVWLSQDFCPTPCVSWHVKTNGAAAGIMVTASHNPPKWNGIKFKESYGGAASADFLQPIEKIIEENQNKKLVPKTKELNGNSLSYFNPHQEYLEALRKLVDLDLIKKANFKILFDPLYGAGSGFLEDLLGNQVTTLHGEADFNFGGLHPEPIQPYVNQAMEKMRSGNFSTCMITDGDADRIGAVDEKGNYVTSHQIFALLLKHLVENKLMKGKVLKSISTTVMIDRLCQKQGLPMNVTPIGFKYLSPAMKEPGVLIGGEESGGIGMPHHIPERDGLFCALLLLELMATKKKLLGELVADLQKEVGPCFYKRIDLTLPKDKIETVKRTLSSFTPSMLAGQKLKKITLIDGYHFSLEDDSWLLIRPSGTEPLLRTYAEAPTFSQVEKLLREAQNLVAKA
ncbi:MAG: phosphoglucomutase/phosphomannomutase family protein [Deltaproteobacteria bacterium]|nr:phosphoglucomutase/phosphomannomutase family protein [Deltaproteobacteria bacterium]